MTGFLPNAPDLFLVHVGMETDLIFTHGLDLPGFASFPLLETEEGRKLIRSYLVDMIAVGRASGCGVILESATWVANRDRGELIGYSVAQLADINTQAIEMIVQMRAEAPDVEVILSANVGPRADAYAPADIMTADEAEHYHAEQMTLFVGADIDVVSGYTFTYPEEVVGLVRAAKRIGLPIVISFTVETDGRLPTGLPLKDAIAQVDVQTDGYASYFMINCAHPDHFAAVLEPASWMARVHGLVANASRCSHAELDDADALDAGDPLELGQQLAALRERFPHLRVLGGCCGTDMRHMTQIATAARH